MSGVRSTWVLACICTSVAAIAGGATATPNDAGSLELGLARTPALYLVIEHDQPCLSIRARGLELDAVELIWVSVVWQGDKAPPELPLPQLWRVTEAPRAEWRRIVAPPELVPYEEDAEVTPGPVRTATPAPPRPQHFVVPTDSGWRLAVARSVAEVAPVGFWRRVVRGWRRLVGSAQPVMPPTLVAVVESETDAQRLVHLFAPGTPVLVGGDPPVASVRPAELNVRP